MLRCFANLWFGSALARTAPVYSPEPTGQQRDALLGQLIHVIVVRIPPFFLRRLERFLLAALASGPFQAEKEDPKLEDGERNEPLDTEENSRIEFREKRSGSRGTVWHIPFISWLFDR